MKLENMFKKTRISSRTQGHGFGRTIRAGGAGGTSEKM